MLDLEHYPAVRRSARLLAVVGALVAQGAMTVTADASPGEIVDVPVSFQVQNTNTSRDPCPSDGKSYVVRGHLTGPRAAVRAPGPRALTLYYEGFDSGEWNWRFRLIPATTTPPRWPSSGRPRSPSTRWATAPAVIPRETTRASAPRPTSPTRSSGSCAGRRTAPRESRRSPSPKSCSALTTSAGPQLRWRRTHGTTSTV